MKIIHTADWHLCDQLRRVDRTDDLRKRVEIVAKLCEEHTADVLLVAGDLFSEQASVEQMTDALKHLHETFADFFARGGTILAVTGNHDKETRVELVRAGMRLATVPKSGSATLQAGRMYLQSGASFAALESGGQRVQFALLPYPTVSRFGDPADVFHSKDEQNRILHGRLAEWIRQVPDRPDFDKGLPTVLAAHLHVRGAELHTLYNVTERDDVVFDPGFLPTYWAYVGLGHIHKPQCLGGMAHVRYPGSLDRLDFGECGDEKGVVLIDVGPAGLRAAPLWLPVPATPMYKVALTDPAELSTLAERYPDHATAIVHLSVTHSPAGPSRDEITHTLRRSFPRYTEITWVRPAANATREATLHPQADYRGTVRQFLAARLAGDPDSAEVLALAETFLTEEAAHDPKAR
jgi:exonuclease SbcD